MELGEYNNDDKKIIREKLNRSRRTSIRWFKLDNYYQRIQHMASDMLKIDPQLPDNVICLLSKHCLSILRKAYYNAIREQRCS